jgi:hypothetical protein
MQQQTVQTPDAPQASLQDGDDMRLAHRYFTALARLEQPAWRKARPAATPAAPAPIMTQSTSAGDFMKAK